MLTAPNPLRLASWDRATGGENIRQWILDRMSHFPDRQYTLNLSLDMTRIEILLHIYAPYRTPWNSFDGVAMSWPRYVEAQFMESILDSNFIKLISGRDQAGLIVDLAQLCCSGSHRMCRNSPGNRFL